MLIIPDRIYIEFDSRQSLKLFIVEILPEDEGVYVCQGKVLGNMERRKTELLLFSECPQLVLWLGTVTVLPITRNFYEGGFPELVELVEL